MTPTSPSPATPATRVTFASQCSKPTHRMRRKSPSRLRARLQPCLRTPVSSAASAAEVRRPLCPQTNQTSSSRARQSLFVCHPRRGSASSITRSCPGISSSETPADPEQGFALIACIVAIFIILLVLAVAAPKISRELQRDRELESLHRGNEYVRAIQLFYRKNGRYPTSVEQLEKTNNIRFLRKKYEDPLTGKPDWRLIFVGQNKTTVKGLFGKPLAGLPTSGAGGAGLGGAGLGGAATVGGSNGGNTSNSFGSSSSFGSSPAAGGTPGGNSNPGSSSTFGGTQTAGGASTPGSTGIGSQSATTFKGAGGPIMGVGSSKTGDSIVVLNEQTDYGTWEFLYDPRIEQLRAKSNLFGGGVGGSGASSSGPGSAGTGNGSINDFSNPGNTPGAPPTSGTPTSPTNPPGPGTPR